MPKQDLAPNSSVCTGDRNGGAELSPDRLDEILEIAARRAALVRRLANAVLQNNVIDVMATARLICGLPAEVVN